MQKQFDDKSFDYEQAHKKAVEETEERFKQRMKQYDKEIAGLKSSSLQEKKNIAQILEVEAKKILEERKSTLEGEVAKLRQQN